MKTFIAKYHKRRDKLRYSVNWRASSVNERTTPPRYIRYIPGRLFVGLLHSFLLFVPSTDFQFTSLAQPANSPRHASRFSLFAPESERYRNWLGSADLEIGSGGGLYLLAKLAYRRAWKFDCASSSFNDQLSSRERVLPPTKTFLVVGRASEDVWAHLPLGEVSIR